MKSLLGAALALGLATPALAAPAYVPAGAVPLGAPDRWDYVMLAAGRVLVAHGDRLEVIDAATGKRVGAVTGIPGGTHGSAIVAGHGYTDDGEAGVAVVFDPQTLRVRKTVRAAPDADGIITDPATGHVLVIEGDPGTLTVIDPAADAAIATISAGEKLEFGVSDGRGSIYVAGEEKGDVVRIDARANVVTAHWPTPGCDRPHGMAVDAVGRRIFMGCLNSRMMVVDADSGRVVAELPIGRGSDALAYDPLRKRVFSPNGQDGTISVYQETSPDAYAPLETVKTQVSGRTMGVDAASGRLFVAAAETDPSPTPGGRPKARPGTLRLLMFDPAP